MSHGYKLRFDQMKENNPTPSESDPQNEGNYYPTKGSIRNLALIFKDGNIRGFPYAFIVDYFFKVNDENNVIILELSSKTISLIGYKLWPLYWEIFDQTPRIIQEVDKRYATGTESAVTKIVIEEKSNG